MRIGLITGEYPPMQGGIADFTRELGRALVELGHDVFVLTDRAGLGRLDEGVTIAPLIHNWNTAIINVVSQWVDQNDLDVVNLHYQTAAYGMAPLIHFLPRRIRSIPFITTFHDLRVPYLFPKAGPLREWWVYRLARDADASIVTNVDDEQQLKRIGGVEIIRRISIGSSIRAEQPAGFDRQLVRDKLGIRKDDFLIGYFGFVNRSKGVDVLLRAVAALQAQGRRVKLVMIGGRTGASDPTNAAYAAENDSLIATLCIENHVVWTGFVEDDAVSAYLFSLDCCALPFQDGVSFRRSSLMAALAHGCPIVSTVPTYPIPEIQSGDSMLLVPPDDHTALASAVACLTEDFALQDQISAGALALYDLFTWERIATQTAGLFSMVCKGSDADR